MEHVYISTEYQHRVSLELTCGDRDPATTKSVPELLSLLGSIDRCLFWAVGPHIMPVVIATRLSLLFP